MSIFYNDYELYQKKFKTCKLNFANKFPTFKNKKWRLILGFIFKSYIKNAVNYRKLSPQSI